MKRHHLIITALAAVALTACNGGSDDNQQSRRAVKVTTTPVCAAPATGGSRYSGTVEEDNATLLSFAVPGTISRMAVKEGDRVSRGQLIATVDAETLNSNHASATAALAQAEDAYRRMEELHGKGSLPEIKWVEAQTALNRARAAEQVAAKQLRDSRLYAPFSGVIAKKMAELGQNVMPGTPVARLVAVGEVKVKIAVPENEIASVRMGQGATETIDALGGTTIRGTVSEKGISADALSRSYEVKISLPNADGKLMPGMVATASLERDGDTSACVIPAHVVQIDENNNEFVWIAKDGKAAKRVITCGEFTANGVTVVSGLSAGDRVITLGQHKVCNGIAVKEVVVKR